MAPSLEQAFFLGILSGSKREKYTHPHGNIDAYEDKKLFEFLTFYLIIY